MWEALMKAAVRKWEAVREFARGLPEAVEEYPWGPEDCVVKVNKKIFVFLGNADGPQPPGLSVKLKDEALHGHAMAAPGAEPSGYGLGRSGWVSVPLGEKGAPSALVLCEWVEESYRTVALKRHVKELDARIEANG
ncbi:MmcQ/YjbR family DNA-binding protein [Streptomyces sp. ISL-44]|uniref:MmcQ/YjbR family DNA-binding protein n=2 Tax=Streptomyces TaxID=1883 RepID=UPI001BE63D67|nr:MULTISPECIES: MmcQ/YjbR family DNA-binding protein [unclassified Streptomyces]MBT2541297.1 MmcQ/YjbR family DNA-binding protein [Streptomyces sp. ISL-44]MCX5010685.1 MmcQ/YjbR family DNA-binding protein [Streptomyces sp. NBC_00555]MCX5611136.1 MmcQ/YjbR family DNA-binding protein [Streptomyces sp. NBC_00047]UUU44493.1 MmcQ/YjbR family DNA-binding protein [Streptomyces sp. NBC_00162]